MLRWLSCQALASGLAFDARSLCHPTLTCLDLCCDDDEERSYNLPVDLSALPCLRFASLSGRYMDFPTGIPSSLEKLMLQSDLNRLEYTVRGSSNKIYLSSVDLNP